MSTNSIEYLKRFLGYGYKVFVLLGAGDRDRTGMALRPRDFKSLASAYFATPACVGNR